MYNLGLTNSAADLNRQKLGYSVGPANLLKYQAENIKVNRFKGNEGIELRRISKSRMIIHVCI